VYQNQLVMGQQNTSRKRLWFQEMGQRFRERDFGTPSWNALLALPNRKWHTPFGICLGEFLQDKNLKRKN
jgi:hypothetical protein